MMKPLTELEMEEEALARRKKQRTPEERGY